MHHVFFSLFDGPAQAAGALRGLAAAGIHQDRVHVLVHDDVHDAHLATEETRARAGLLYGTIVGCLTGALTGTLLGGRLAAIPGGAAAATFFGAFFGAIAGALGGVLTGAADPDRHFERLAAGVGRGKVLVTVDAADLRTEERVEALLRDHGAIVEKRDVL